MKYYLKSIGRTVSKGNQYRPLMLVSVFVWFVSTWSSIYTLMEAEETLNLCRNTVIVRLRGMASVGM